MYLALEKMSLRQPDCTVAAVEPGQEVPGFEDWPIWTKQAMLQQQQVRWAPEGLAPHEKQGKRVVHQHLPTTVLGPPAKPPVVAQGPELYVPGRTSPAEEGYQALVVDSAAKPVRKRGRPAKAAAPAKQVPAAKPQPAPVAEAAAAESPLVPTPSRQFHDGVVAYAQPPAKKGAHDCPQCERQGFKDFNGLRVHMATAHQVTD